MRSPFLKGATLLCLVMLTLAPAETASAPTVSLPTTPPAQIPTPVFKTQALSPPTAATGESSVPIVNTIYIAFAAPEATREPTQEEYALMTDLTSEYLDSYITGYYKNDADSSFIRTELTLKDTLYNAGIPDERFNVYMEFFAKLVFSSESALPTSDEAFALVRDSISPDYILDYVRSAVGTPFESTNEVVLRQDGDGAVPTPAPMESMTTEPTSEEPPTSVSPGESSASIVGDIYIAFVAPEATREPTQEEYALMTDLTSEYFDSYFTGYYKNDADSSFIRTELTLKDTLYNAGI
jgi:hypothetical protein